MIRLDCGPMQAWVRPQGAELSSLLYDGFEYLWSGDATYWGKQSPVLFPIVGSLRGGHYRHRGLTYALPRHGFARERPFQVRVISGREAHFSLEDDEASRLVYPFRFQLRIRYLLRETGLEVEYAVANPSEETMYFSIGGHPAFRVPVEPGLAYEDYHLAFEQPETAGRWKLLDGLLLREEPGFLQDSDRIPLSHGLFAEDAVVLKGLRSSHLTLRSDKGGRGLRFGIGGWPHLGLWAPVGAPFLCIEPWQGHADPVDADGELGHKPGIVSLEPGGCWERSWTVEPFSGK
jgi:galactose mutarotase-like enzyme